MRLFSILFTAAILLFFKSAFAQNNKTATQLTQAKSLLDENKLKEAINLLEKASIKDSLGNQVVDLLADSYKQYARKLANSKEKTEYDVALNYIDKYTKLYKKVGQPITLANVATLYGEIASALFFSNKDFQSAARVYKLTIKKYKKADWQEVRNLKEANHKLAQCYLELGNFTAAQKHYYKTFGNNRDLNAIADSLYCERKFSDAARLYRLNKNKSKLEDTKGFDLQIARSYQRSNNNKRALEWYSKFLSEKDIAALENKVEIAGYRDKCDEARSLSNFYLAKNYEIQDLDIYNYAQALLNESGRYLSAKELFDKYTFIMEEDPNIDRVRFLEGETIITRKLSTSDVNSDFSSEFSPVFYKQDSIVFVSDRNVDGDKVKTLNGEQRSTLDLYYTSLDSVDYFGFFENGNNITKDTSLYSQSVNKFIDYKRAKKYNEGPLVFLPGTWDKFIFTGNTFLETKALSDKSTDEINTLKLFLAEKDSLGEWKVSKFNFVGNNNDYIFNNEDYSVGHPSLSADGKKIYFSSDAPYPGSFGNSDLYEAEIDVNKLEIANVKNLGENINTEGNEVFPNWYKNQDELVTLYFSSNKAEGLGGLDIYRASLIEDEWQMAINMKNEFDTLNSINSDKDDFSLILNKQGNFGYFSSDRDSTDDIYMFRNFKIEISVCEKATGKPLHNANVAIFPTTGKRLGPKKTDTNGQTIFSKFTLDTDYTVFASLYGYRPAKLDFSTLLKNVPADGIFKYQLCLETSPEAELIILANVKSDQQIFIKFNKDVEELNDKMPITANNLYELFYNENNNYLVDTEFGPNIGLNFKNGEVLKVEGMETKKCQEKLIAIFDENGILVKDIVTIRNIRYNFATNEFTKGDNETVIPEEEFTKLATVLERNKNLQLKISSHTDKCPLNGNYDNLALSRRRNQAARDFITTHFPDYNISINRIKECAYTFNYPVDTTYNAPDYCKNDFNRRTEFKLLYKGRDGYTMDMLCDPNMIEYIGKPEVPLKKKRRGKRLADR